MARGHEYIYALNAGGVDTEAVVRVDLEKLRLAGAFPVANFLPRVLGASPLRPGLELITAVPGNQQARLLPVEISSSVSYALLFTDQEYRVIDDDLLVQVAGPTSTILNPDFDDPLTADVTTGWKDETTGSATASTAGGLLLLTAGESDAARVQQAVMVGVPDIGVAHTIRLEVTRGPVLFRVGTAPLTSNLLPETAYDTGTHKVTITPPGVGTLYLQIRSEDTGERQVTRVEFENKISGTGDLVLPTPYLTADLEFLDWAQSIDKLFIGEGTKQQQIAVHRGATSWSMVDYKTSDGPFSFNTNRTISVLPGALSGNTTMLITEPFFEFAHVGSLIEITHRQQTVTSTLSAAGQSSAYITVNGIDGARAFTRIADFTTGSFVGILTLQRSTEPSDPVIWSDYKSFDEDFTGVVEDDDGLNNLTVHYRWTVKAGDYTSGSVDATLLYDGGTQTGVARITKVISGVSLEIEVLQNFGAAAPSREWRLGDWSGVSGYPRVPVFDDGRLWWFRGDQAYGSVSDAFTTFDDETIGDSGPISRSVGSGAVEGVQWAASLDRLVVGTTGFEASIQADDYGTTVTPTAYNVRQGSTRGSARVRPAKTDDALFFVHRSGKRLYELLRADSGSGYGTRDISRLVPFAMEAGIKRLAIQRHPDTRLYMVMDDGQCFVLTYERDDEVVAFTTITATDILFDDVVVLPGVAQDRVLFICNFNGLRYVMRLGLERDQTAAVSCTLLDGHKVFTGVNATLFGLDHFNGRSDVYAYVDGLRQGPFTVTAGTLTLTTPAATRAVAGLAFTASFKSVKLAYAAQLGSAIGQLKQVHQAGLVLQNSCLDGVRIGAGPTMADPMPDFVDGAQRTPGQVFAHYDHELQSLQGEWNADSRFYFEVDSSHGPFTAQSIVLDVETREGYTPRGNG